MDNVATHKVAGIREAIEARGATLLYLPPYSPDLNPIEKAFAKIKATLRTIGARTRKALWQAIGEAIVPVHLPLNASYKIEITGYSRTPPEAFKPTRLKYSHISDKY
jgi:transposase